MKTPMNCSDPIEIYQLLVLLYIRKICSGFSLLGCSWIMVSMIVLKNRYRQQKERNIFSLSLSSFLLSIGNLLTSTLDSCNNNPNFQRLCIAQGWIIQFSENALFTWVAVIAIELCLVVYLQPTEKLEKFYHMGVWAWAVIGSTVPLLINGTDVYGIAGIWCWFPNHGDYLIYRFTLFYGPYMIQVIIVIVLTGLVIRKLKQIGDGTNIETRKIILYPIMFLILYIFPMINRINDAVHPNDPCFALYVLHCLSSPLLGMSFALVYGSDSEIRQFWIRICCCMRNEEQQPKEGHKEENQDQVTPNLST